MSSPNRILPYSRQLIEEDDIAAVAEVLRSDYLTQGPKVAEFERALAEYTGAKFAVAFATGTAALHGAYFAAGLQPGEEVITTPNTFAATANAALYLGARPVFADIQPDTGNIDSSEIEKHITPRTRILAPVDYSGHPADMDAINAIASRHNLIVVSDASHSLGATHKGRKVGALADMTTLSFHPVKPITTGEGGAVLTDSEAFYQRLMIFRTHGITKDPAQMTSPEVGDWFYEQQHLGFNYRITDIQCALGVSQLRKIDRFLAEQRHIAARYTNAFSQQDGILPYHCREGVESAWHLYPLRLVGKNEGRRREFFDVLRRARLWVQVHYIPVYWHPYYQSLGYTKGLCPKAEAFYESEISIPIFPGMDDQELEYVINTVIKACRR